MRIGIKPGLSSAYISLPQISNMVISLKKGPIKICSMVEQIN